MERERIGVWQKSRILVGLGLRLGYDWGLQKPSIVCVNPSGYVLY